MAGVVIRYPWYFHPVDSNTPSAAFIAEIEDRLLDCGWDFWTSALGSPHKLPFFIVGALKLDPDMATNLYWFSITRSVYATAVRFSTARTQMPQIADVSPRALHRALSSAP